MTIDRRTVIKGMAAGGALLGLGMPKRGIAASLPSNRKPVLLLLGGSEANAAFASGVNEVMNAHGEGRVIGQRIQGDDVEHVSKFFAERNGTRLVGIMADGTYAVFHELAREAAVQLLSLGRHSSSGDPSSGGSRE